MTAQQRPTYGNGCIVLPFQPVRGRSFDGVGLALHFLLGNVMVLHSGLKEIWFGWRIGKIFHNSADLAAYCRGVPLQVTLKELSRQEKVRFWAHGNYNHYQVEIGIFDARRSEIQLSASLSFSLADHLVEFRRAFIDLLGQCGKPFPNSQRENALWEERVSMHGLDTVGRALESFYQFSAFQQDHLFDLKPFEKAVRQAPDSYVALDLLGWAHYRMKNYSSANDMFKQALTINPGGAGAMSGLMWCGVHTHDREKTLKWAQSKAKICEQDQAVATKQAIHRFDKHGD